MHKSAGLLHRMLDEPKLSNVRNLLQVSASPYWEAHYIFDKTSRRVAKRLGDESIDVVLINTVSPFLFVFGKMKNDSDMQARAIKWLEEVKPEKNKITRKFNELGFKPVNAMHSQALLQMKTRYCDQKKCLSCSIGQVLLNQTVLD
jgi:hypothetical protein